MADVIRSGVIYSVGSIRQMHQYEVTIMTSTHRLVAIISVWMAVGFTITAVFGISISLFLPVEVLVGLSIAFALTGLLATLLIVRGETPSTSAQHS